MMISNSNKSGHALVIGGSMAGLLAARILLNHFERVTLIERDRFPTEPQSRPGVPQATHTHVLLIRGKQILIDLFPSLENEFNREEIPQIKCIKVLQQIIKDKFSTAETHYEQIPTVIS